METVKGVIFCETCESGRRLCLAFCGPDKVYILCCKWRKPIIDGINRKRNVYEFKPHKFYNLETVESTSDIKTVLPGFKKEFLLEIPVKDLEKIHQVTGMLGFIEMWDG